MYAAPAAQYGPEAEADQYASEHRSHEGLYETEQPVNWEGMASDEPRYTQQQAAPQAPPQYQQVPQSPPSAYTNQPQEPDPVAFRQQHDQRLAQQQQFQQQAAQRAAQRAAQARYYESMRQHAALQGLGRKPEPSREPQPYDPRVLAAAQRRGVWVGFAAGAVGLGLVMALKSWWSR